MGRKDTIKGKKNMEVEDIMGYINGLSQQHKIFLHRTLATWRNLTVDNYHRGLKMGWMAWQDYLKNQFAAEKARNNAADAIELREFALSALMSPTDERSDLDVSRIVNWFKFTNIFGKKLSPRAVMIIAKEAALWEAEPNQRIFLQGMRGDGEGGPRLPENYWWQWGFYFLISGKINLYSFSDKSLEMAALEKMTTIPHDPYVAGVPSFGVLSDWNQDDEATSVDSPGGIVETASGRKVPRAPRGTFSPVQTASGVPVMNQRGAPVRRESAVTPMSPGMMRQAQELGIGDGAPPEGSLEGSLEGADAKRSMYSTASSKSTKSPLTYEPTSPSYVSGDKYSQKFQQQSVGQAWGGGPRLSTVKTGVEAGHSPKTPVEASSEPLSGGGGSMGRRKSSFGGGSVGSQSKSKSRHSSSSREPGSGRRSSAFREPGSGRSSPGSGRKEPRSGRREPGSGGRLREPDSSGSRRSSKLRASGGPTLTSGSIDSNTADPTDPSTELELEERDKATSYLQGTAATPGPLGNLIFSTGEPGHGFGEMSLLNTGAPFRSASAVVAEKSMILVIGPLAFEKSLSPALGPALGIPFKMKFLAKEGGLFCQWRPAQAAQLAYVLQEEKYLPKDVIAKQGEPIDRYFIVRSGSVRASVQLPIDGQGGKQASKSTSCFEAGVGRMGEGSLMDDVALIEGSGKFTTDLTAETVVEVYSIKVTDLDRWIGNGPGAAKKTLQSIKSVAERRREMRFAAVAKAKFSMGTMSDDANPAKMAGNRFTSPAYRLAWSLAELKASSGAGGHGHRSLSTATAGQGVQLGRGVVKFTKVRAPEASDSLPTASPFSLLQVINSGPR